MKRSMFELGLRNTTPGARDFSSAVSGFYQALYSDPRGFGLRHARKTFGIQGKVIFSHVIILACEDIMFSRESSTSISLVFI